MPFLRIKCFWHSIVMISFQEGAYFYPKEIQQRLIELGRTDQKTIDRKRKICMTSFYVVLPVAMLLIIGC